MSRFSGVMNVQITSKNWNLPESDREFLERRSAHITKNTPHFSAELLHLVVKVDRHSRRNEYQCVARLSILGDVVAARSTFNAVPRAAISDAFDGLERKVDKVLDLLKAHA